MALLIIILIIAVLCIPGVMENLSRLCLLALFAGWAYIWLSILQKISLTAYLTKLLTWIAEPPHYPGLFMAALMLGPLPFVLVGAVRLLGGATVAVLAGVATLLIVTRLWEPAEGIVLLVGALWFLGMAAQWLYRKFVGPHGKKEK